MSQEEDRIRKAVALVLAGAVGVALVVVLARRPDPSRVPEAEAARAAAPAPGEAEPAAPPPALAAARPDPAADPGDALPITGLPLRLLATAVVEAPARSFARIEDAQWSESQLVLEGQALAGRPRVTLAQIETHRVVLDNYGVLEQLPLDARGQTLFDGSADAAEPPPLDPAERERRRDLGERLLALSEAGADYEPRTVRGGLAAEALAEPVYEDGQLAGVRLRDVRPGGVYDRAGLRNGDVLTAVNGVEMGGPDTTAKLVAELVSAQELAVDVERAEGGSARVTVPTAELLRDLSALPVP